MENMTREQADILNVVQQVLRTTLVALCAAAKAEPEKLGALLESGAANAALDPVAQNMLSDLAVGLALIAKAGRAQS